MASAFLNVGSGFFSCGCPLSKDVRWTSLLTCGLEILAVAKENQLKAVVLSAVLWVGGYGVGSLAASRDGQFTRLLQNWPEGASDCNFFCGPWHRISYRRQLVYALDVDIVLECDRAKICKAFAVSRLSSGDEISLTDIRPRLCHAFAGESNPWYGRPFQPTYL